MLIAFSCNNFASFRDQIVFSMEATAKKEFSDFNTFSTEQGTYLKSAFIFGSNGSGKSNLFKSIRYMKNMVNFSVFDEKLIKKNDHFKFLKMANEIPTGFEIVFELEGVVWKYGFEILNGKIISEWLIKKVKRSTKVFERNGSNWENIQCFGEWKKYESLRQHTREDALFLSLASMLNVAPALKIHDWFQNLQVFTHDEVSPGYTVDLLEESPAFKKRFLSFLRKADLAIEDFVIKVEEEELSEAELKSFFEEQDLALPADRVNVRKRGLDIRTRHKLYDQEHNEIGTVMLPFIQYQSTGTVKFFELLGPIFKTLNNGGILIIDEIDSRLHPLLVHQIVSLFHSLNTNQRNGQLIANTHNVLLLEEQIRRDQIWFMQKGKQGSSELYSLIDFPNIRVNDLILKKYLLGVFKAIPFFNSSNVEEDYE